MDTHSDNIVAISQLLDDSYPEGLDEEAHRWRRCMKVTEEAGEVTKALLGMVGENPRKGVTNDVGEVRMELLDVAVAALAAVAHLDGNHGDPVRDMLVHAAFVRGRLARALFERSAS